MEMGMEMEWIDGMGQFGLVGLLQIVTSSPAALESQLGSKVGQLAAFRHPLMAGPRNKFH